MNFMFLFFFFSYLFRMSILIFILMHDSFIFCNFWQFREEMSYMIFNYLWLVQKQFDKKVPCICTGQNWNKIVEEIFADVIIHILFRIVRVPNRLQKIKY